MTQDRRAFLEKLAAGGVGVLAGGLILRPHTASADDLTPEQVQAMLDAYNAMLGWGVNQNSPPSAAWVIAAVQTYGVTSEVNDINPGQAYTTIGEVQDALEGGFAPLVIPDCEWVIERRMGIDRVAWALNTIAGMYAFGAAATFVSPPVSATLAAASGLAWFFSSLLSGWSSDLAGQPCS